MAYSKEKWREYAKKRRERIKTGLIVPVKKNNRWAILDSITVGERFIFEVPQGSDYVAAMNVCRRAAMDRGKKITCSLVLGVLPEKREIIEILLVTCTGENPMKTTAQIIVDESENAADAMTAADAIKEGDQDWEHETTTWTFDDGSRLIVSGMEFRAE